MVLLLAIGPHIVLAADGIHDRRSARTTVQPYAAGLSLSPASLPAATEGLAYDATIDVSTGGGGYTFAVSSGTLPAGLVLGIYGDLSGTPTVNGTFTFTIAATGSGLATVAQQYVLTVNAVPVLIALAPASPLPGGAVNAAYSQTITATGGIAPYSYAVTAGSLPAGLTLSMAGVLAGTPISAGNDCCQFTITATDSAGNTGSLEYQMGITPLQNLVMTAASATAQTVHAGGSASYAFNLTQSYAGYPAVTFAASGLPAGATASFTPSTLPNEANGTVTMTVHTSESARLAWPLSNGASALALLLLPMVGLKRIRRRSRRAVILLPMLLLGGLAGISLSGCGGNDTPPVTSSITVTATSGYDSTTATVTLTEKF